MYYHIKDFISDWNDARNSTLKLFNNLTDESLSQRVTGDGRTLGFIAWHITTGIGEMLNRIGIITDSPAENSPVPLSASQIVDAYNSASSSIIDAVNKWSDDDLMKEVNLYGENWKNGYTLSILIVHQIHHCGQLTVLMRQAGLKVPGVCGPSKEEWAAYGMEAQP